MLNYPKHTS